MWAGEMIRYMIPLLCAASRLLQLLRTFLSEKLEDLLTIVSTNENFPTLQSVQVAHGTVFLLLPYFKAENAKL